MSKKRWKGCMSQQQWRTAKKQCFPDPTGLAHIETHQDWSNMYRSKPDGVLGPKGKVERNSILNSEAIFKCQLPAEEKKKAFFFPIGILLSIQTLLMPIMARTMWTQWSFWRLVFSSLFELHFLPLLFFFCICVMVSDFVFLSACVCVCVSGCACVYLDMLVYVFLMFYSFLYLFFSFLKSEKRKIWGWMGEEAVRIWEEKREKKLWSEYIIW